MISRRSLHKGILGSLGAMPLGLTQALGSVKTDSLGDLLIGGGKFTEPGSNNQRLVLSLLRIAESQPELISLDFFPHGISVRPNKPNQILVMEKKGPGCALVDIASKEVLLDVQASKNCWFYGHGAYTKNGDHCYVVETDLTTNRGLLSIREAESGKILGEMDTHGANPHDCQLVVEENFLAITNSGLGRGVQDKNTAPCVTFVDASSGKLLERIPLTKPELNAGHLLVTDNRDLAVVSAPREGMSTSALGGISLRPKDLSMESLSNPEDVLGRLVGETLSLAYHAQTDLLAATTPDANVVSFWKMSDRSFAGSVRLPEPKGVCLNADQTHFLVSAAATPVIYSINAMDLENIGLAHQNPYVSGSHLYNWTLESEKLKRTS